MFLTQFWKDKTYTSVDNISIGLFTEILESGDFGKLVIKSKYHVLKRDYTRDELESIWEVIYDEYLGLFGNPETFESYVRKKTMALELWQDVFNGEVWKTALARVADHEAESVMKQSGSNLEIDEVLADMSMITGFDLDKYNVTVSKFYGYQKAIERKVSNERKNK